VRKRIQSSEAADVTIVQKLAVEALIKEEKNQIYMRPSLKWRASGSDESASSIALAWIWREVLLLAGHAFPLLGVCRRLLLHGNVGPCLGSSLRTPLQ
jgi:hypothetical protein